MAGENILKLGIPKGSLQDATIALFEKSGWKVHIHHRNYFPEINDPELTCSMARGRYDQAAQALADVLVQDPDNAYAATRLGLADASLGRTEAARAVLGKVLAANPTNLSALWMLGCLDLLGGHPEQAVARFTAMGPEALSQLRGTPTVERVPEGVALKIPK